MVESEIESWNPQQQIVTGAQQGDIFSQIAAGDMYYAQAEFDQAFEWYSLAMALLQKDSELLAEDGARVTVLAAECRLAHMYFNGLGIDTDKKMAFELYSQAARQRFLEAQVQLGMMYSYGDAVPMHLGLGYAWLYAAKVNGENTNEIKKTMKQIEKKMDSAALDNAKKMAEQWIDETRLAALSTQKTGLLALFNRLFQ